MKRKLAPWTVYAKSERIFIFLMETKWKVIWGVVAIVVVLGLSAAYSTYSALNNPPDFTQLRRSVTITVKDVSGAKTSRRFGPATADWVPLGSISTNLVHAVISQEDTSFFHHKGVDFHELKEAIKQDIKEQRYARGASTITQQVIKNAFLDQRKTLWRKIKEFFWARAIEEKLRKKEILAFYLNMVEWGPGIYGIGEASQYYFGSEPSELNAKQSAFLAMLLPSPVKYHNRYFVTKDVSDWAAKRIARTLRVMYRMRFIDKEAYQNASETSLFGEELTPLPENWEESEPQVERAEKTPSPESSTQSASPEPSMNPEGSVVEKTPEATTEAEVTEVQPSKTDSGDELSKTEDDNPEPSSLNESQ